MARPLPQEVWSWGFSHGEKYAQKGGDLSYSLYVAVAQLVRPTKEKEKKDNLALSGGYQKKKKENNFVVFERCEPIDSTREDK